MLHPPEERAQEAESDGGMARGAGEPGWGRAVEEGARGTDLAGLRTCRVERKNAKRGKYIFSGFWMRRKDPPQ